MGKYKNKNSHKNYNYGGSIPLDTQSQIERQKYDSAVEDYQRQQQLNQGINGVASAIPGYGQLYGAARGLTGGIQGMLGEETYNADTGKIEKTYSSNVEEGLDNTLKPAHEHTVDEFSEGDWVSGIHSIFSPGSYLIGKNAGIDWNFKNGGRMYNNGGDLKLTEFTEGGKHEQNPNGGIPLGPNAFVEEGETMYDNFIFSDTLKVNKELAEEYSLPKKAIGKTFAEVSKMFDDDERPNDVYTKNMRKKDLKNLIDAHEAYKQVEGIDTQKQMVNGGPVKPNNNLLTKEELEWLATQKRGVESAGHTSQRYKTNPSGHDEAFRSLTLEQKKQLDSYMEGTDFWTDFKQAITPNTNYFNPKPKNSKLALGGPMHDPDEFNNSGIFDQPYLNIDYSLLNDLDPSIESDPSFGKFDLPSDPTRPIDESTLIDNSNFQPTKMSITRQPDNQEYIDYADSMGKKAVNTNDSNLNANYLRYAPLLSDLGSLAYLLGNKPTSKDINMFNTNTKFKENLVNRDQIKRDIESQKGAVDRQLVSASGGNAGSLLSNLQGSSLNTQRALANANLSSDELDSREKARVESMNYQQDANNQRSRMLVTEMNDKDQGQYNTLLLDSMNNFGNNLGNVGLDEYYLKLASQLPVGYTIDRNGNVVKKIS